MNWITRIFVAAVIGLGSTAHSQEVDNIRAPVNVLYKLYMGCFQAHFDTMPITVTTKKSVTALLDQLDDQCLVWMIVWYEPLMGAAFDKLPADTTRRFAAIRQHSINILYKELLIAHKIKK